MPKISVDGIEHIVEDGLTIIQACESLGVQIPRFCYHKKLAIAGNCRMCLVEVEKAPKPVASCSITVTEGMVIKTESPLVKKAREGVMEFMLINHPLDCPICDQGGECDLQDQAFEYGKCKSEYKEEKRAVEDKYMGPVIKTHMTRCIHCTRCVRFIEDIAGTTELGAVGRGEHMEVTTYIESSIKSELSGNIIDLCPVGALTSKPYAFTARSWELKHTYSVDVTDAVGSHIRVDTRDDKVMRILPQTCEDINEEWLSDKARFSYDGLKYQRLDKCFSKENSKLKEIEYSEAVDIVADLLRNSSRTLVVAGKLTDAETMFAAKSLNLENTHYDHEVSIHGLISNNRSDYLLNSTIADLENSDYILLVNTNPRHEAALVNARIRKAVFHKNAAVKLIGVPLDLNYKYDHLGDDANEILLSILEGSHPEADKIQKANKPAIIIGSTVFSSKDSKTLHSLCKEIARKYGFIKDGWNGFNILHHCASSVAALDLGFVNHVESRPDLVILLGADDVNLENFQDAKVVYIGHHGDKSVYRADVIIPSPAYTEKSGTYINAEGRVQRTVQAVSSLGCAKPEHQIMFDVAGRLGLELDWSDLSSLRDSMAKDNEIFSEENLFKVNRNQMKYENFDIKKLKKLNFDYPISDFYMTDSISRASKIMSQCSKENK